MSVTFIHNGKQLTDMETNGGRGLIIATQQQQQQQQQQQKQIVQG